jgi:hypothetical protein
MMKTQTSETLSFAEDLTKSIIRMRGLLMAAVSVANETGKKGKSTRAVLAEMDSELDVSEDTAKMVVNSLRDAN